MKIAFYAPLKPPNHPTPSGDRAMARLLMAALRRAGHDVELASRFRSFDGTGSATRQARLAELGSRLAGRYLRRVTKRQTSGRPDLWFTYHLYHKAPDWLGPVVSHELGIPYFIAEASVAPKRADGDWAGGHAAVVRAIGMADAVIGLNPVDKACVAPHLATPERWRDLAPFIDPAPLTTARPRGDLSDAPPLIVSVAMMRPGDKLASYRILAEALTHLTDIPWTLAIVGDGDARAEVEAAFAGLAQRVSFLGALPPEGLPEVLTAGDLYAWPGVREAFGMAYMEAQAAGLPVVGGKTGGVPGVVADGETGLLVDPEDPLAVAAAIRRLLTDDALRATMAQAAPRKIADFHSLNAAADSLGRMITEMVVR